jgi:hypothetical protein
MRVVAGLWMARWMTQPAGLIVLPNSPLPGSTISPSIAILTRLEAVISS